MEAGTHGALGLAISAIFLLSATPAAADEDDAGADLSLDLGGATLELRRIPKGRFTEGSPPDEPGREADEAPRPVLLTHDFWLGKAPVTRGQFGRFVTETRYVTEAEKGQSGGFGWDPASKQLVQKKEFNWRNPGFTQTDNDPVVLVTFGDANAFTTWVFRKTGRHVRLPTEAEWEYAARAGTTTPWYAGKTEDEALASGWLKANAGASTHPVAQKRPNPFGLFDMTGNVYEWCRDIYAPYPAGPAVDPENKSTAAGTTEPERRVLRGGSWLKDPKRARSAARWRNTAGSRNADNGFRVALGHEDDMELAPGVTPGAATATTMPLSPSGTPITSSTAAASATSTPSGTAPNTGGPLWALLAAPAAAAAAVVAWMLARRRRGTHTSPSGVTTRAAEDGFYVTAPNAPAGSRLRYSCIVNDVEVSDVVPLEAEGTETFVYTGGRPSAIQILEVVLVPRKQGYRGTPQPAPRPAPPVVAVVTPPPDPEPFIGRPRAY